MKLLKLIENAGSIPQLSPLVPVAGAVVTRRRTLENSPDTLEIWRFPSHSCKPFAALLQPQK